MKKKELRKIYREKRLSITEKEKLKSDDLLLIQFQNLSFQNIQTLLTYSPMQHTAEPDMYLFTRYLQHMIPALQIAYPVTDFLSNTMQAMLVNEDTIFTQNSYQIEEPTGGEIISPENIDLLFVPMLICDKKGNRVGYGKGFYDRYLRECRDDILKIGFSYFPPVEIITDVHRFDIPLNFCITPQNIYAF